MKGFLKKTLIFIAVMAVVASAGWFGRKAYHKAAGHQLVAEAQKYLGQKDVRNASLCLQRALQLNPLNLDANRLVADMLEEAGDPSAVAWRIRVYQIQTNNVENCFAWAQTALKMKDTPSAVQALRDVPENKRSSVQFHKLAGVLAWNVHDVTSAEKEFTEALQLDPSNLTIVLNLASVRLSSTNSSVADQARLTLEQIPASSPLHLTALRYLAIDAVSHKSLDRALVYSQQTVKDPQATYADKLAHLQILHEADSPGFDAWQAALADDAAKSPAHAYALGDWIQRVESPAAALLWLQSLPFATQTNLPVPLAITDCQISLKEWPGMLGIVTKQDWGELNYYRLALESLGRQESGETRESEMAWQKALTLCSHRLDRLTRLNQIISAWKWTSERCVVLEKIVEQFPKETWADEQLIALYYAQGKTRELAYLLDEMLTADPTNIRLKNNLASLLLLRKSDLEKARRMALEAYDSDTNNPFYACTYAYSLLLQSKPAEAAKIFSSMKTDYLKNPSIAAYYGIVEAEVGNKMVAKAPLQLAGNAKLLPEEMELVRQASARL